MVSIQGFRTQHAVDCVLRAGSALGRACRRLLVQDLAVRGTRVQPAAPTRRQACVVLGSMHLLDLGRVLLVQGVASEAVVALQTRVAQGCASLGDTVAQDQCPALAPDHVQLGTCVPPVVLVATQLRNCVLLVSTPQQDLNFVHCAQRESMAP